MAVLTLAITEVLERGVDVYFGRNRNGVEWVRSIRRYERFVVGISAMP